MFNRNDVDTKQKRALYKIGYESLWVLIGLIFIQGLMKALNIAFCTGSTGNLLLIFIVINYFGIRKLMLNCYDSQEDMKRERKLLTIVAPIATIITVVLMIVYDFSSVNIDGDANAVVLALIGTISAWIATFMMWKKKDFEEKR
ncbi:hypothetical protein [Anaerosporobacter sp.]